MIVTYYVVVVDAEGNENKVHDLPKDVEQVLDGFIMDMEN